MWERPAYFLVNNLRPSVRLLTYVGVEMGDVRLAQPLPGLLSSSYLPKS
jgi:hypothetical protein